MGQALKNNAYGQKLGRANSQINAAGLTAAAANPAPSCSSKTWCRDNKTTAQPSVHSRSARSTRLKRPALNPVQQTLCRQALEIF